MDHSFLIGDGQFVCDEIQYIYNTTVSSHCLIYSNIYNKVNLKNTLSQNKYQHYFIQSTYKEFYQMIWIPHVELTLGILLRWQTILFGIPYGVSVYNVIIEIQESLVSPVYPVSRGLRLSASSPRTSMPGQTVYSVYSEYSKHLDDFQEGVHSKTLHLHIQFILHEFRDIFVAEVLGGELVYIVWSFFQYCPIGVINVYLICWVYVANT